MNINQRKHLPWFDRTERTMQEVKSISDTIGDVLGATAYEYQGYVNEVTHALEEREAVLAANAVEVAVEQGLRRRTAEQIVERVGFSQPLHDVPHSATQDRNTAVGIRAQFDALVSEFRTRIGEMLGD